MKSAVDQKTQKPQPAAFQFRYKDDKVNELYLSVNWLEFLGAGEADVKARLEALRQFQSKNEHHLPMMKLAKGQAYAVLNVGQIHAGTAEYDGTKVDLQCRHEPEEGFEHVDPHSGITPSPGVHTWPTGEGAKDAPAHLAVQLFLYSLMGHYEPVLTA